VAWKELAAQIGTQALVGGLRAIEGKVSKRQYKRLLATAVAQLLELHPKLGRGKARRWARKATGARPLKKVAKAADDIGLKEGLEAAAVAAAGAGAAKVVRSLARPLRKRASGAVPSVKEAGSDVARPAR
jgi:hypothetical protein